MTAAQRIAQADPAEVAADYHRLGLDRLSDHDLVEAAAAVLAWPRVGPPDSFVLHAPLELLARWALLPHVDPTQRERARQRIVWLASTYARADAPASRVATLAVDDAETAAVRLAAAIAAGELDDAEAAAAWLGAHADAADIARLLVDAVGSSLAAAAHAGIFLYLLPRVAPHSPLAATMLRAPARELAREPEWAIAWIDDPAARSGRSGTDLADALVATPRVEPPPSMSIYPLVHHVDASGAAAAIVGAATEGIASPAELRIAARQILRVAAWSMLQDDPEHAPYGWSHCLTIPQGFTGLAGWSADPLRTIRIAATHVTAFRASLSAGPISATWRPAAEAEGDVAAALGRGPEVAAATVLGGGVDPASVVTTLATRAALHPDAHLAKYTVACLDAARVDPAMATTYLAAAAHLSAWWASTPVEHDPILAA
jgi:hypothetical protein